MAGVVADSVLVSVEGRFQQYERDFDRLIQKTETGMAKLRRLTEKPVSVSVKPKTSPENEVSKAERAAKKKAEAEEKAAQRKIAADEKAAQRAQAASEKAAASAEKAAKRKAEADEKAAQRSTAAAEKAAARQAEIAVRAQARADAAAAKAQAAQDRIAAAVERGVGRSAIAPGSGLGGRAGDRAAAARQTANMRAGTALGGRGSMAAPTPAEDKINYLLRDQIDTQARFNAARASGNRAEAEALRDQLTQFRLINQYRRAGLDEVEATSRAEQRVADIQRRRGANLPSIRAGAAGAGAQAGRGVTLGGVVSGIRSAATIGFAGYGAVQGAREYLELTDAYKQYNAQLKLATAENGNLAQAQADTQRIAAETRTGLAETADLYGTFQRNATQLGLTQEQAARATETVTKTFKISGATSAEAAGGLRQFLQALQSGTLRGEEFNSVVENAPRLAKLLADQLAGGNIGALRALSQAGKITGEDLKKALTDQRFTAQIDAEFKELPVTFDQAMTLVKNAAITTIGEFDRGGQFSTALANFITDGTGGFDDLAKSALHFGQEARAIIEGLGNVFDPLAANGNSVFDALGIKVSSVSEQIRSVLGSFDAIGRAGAGVANFVNIPGQYLRSQLGQRTAPVVYRGNAQGNYISAEAFSRAQSRQREQASNIDARFGGLRGLGGFVRGERSALGQDLRARAARVDPDTKKYQDQIADLEKLKVGASGKELATINKQIAKRQAIVSNLNKGVGIEAARAAVGSSGRSGPSAETLAKRAETARLREVRREDAYNAEVENLNSAILSAKGKQAQGIEATAAAAIANADAELKERETKYQNQENEGKINDAQRLVLVGLAKQVRAQDVLAANTEKAASLASEALQRQADLASNEADAIRAQLDMARTREQRERLQQQLLDKEYEARRDALVARYNDAKPGSPESLNIEGQLQNLPVQKAADEDRNRQDNRSPYQRYRDNLNSADSLSDEIDGIKIEVLDRVADSLADATTNALGLTGALGDVVGQIIKIGIQRRLIGPLADSLFGKADGSSGGGLGAIFGGGSQGNPSGVLSLLGGLFGGARASGGDVSAGRLYRINENGPEFFQPAMSGKIIPTGRARDAGGGGNTTIVQQTFTIDNRGGITTPQLLDYVNQRARTEAATAGKAAYNASPQRQQKLQQLGS